MYSQKRGKKIRHYSIRHIKETQNTKSIQINGIRNQILTYQNQTLTYQNQTLTYSSSSTNSSHQFDELLAISVNNGTIFLYLWNFFYHAP